MVEKGLAVKLYRMNETNNDFKNPICSSFYENIGKVFERVGKTFLKSIEDSSATNEQFELQIKTDFEDENS